MLTCVVSIKGGVSKSLIAVHYAAYLHRKGRKTALIDADPQHTARRWLAEAEPTLRVEAIDVRKRDARGAIFDLVEKLDGFDHIVADGPAGMIEHTRALLTVCDLAVIPSGPSIDDLHLAAKTVEMAKSESKIRRGDPIAIKIVLTRIVRHSNVGREAIDVAGGICRVAKAIISQRSAYADSWGRLIFDMGYAAKPAAMEMTQLAGELLKWPVKRHKTG